MAKDSSKSSKDAKTTETKTTRKEHKTTPKCGIIMPISDMGDYTEQHWKDVREMIEGALEDTDFQCDLVSNAKETRVIHNTIVQNIYDNEIVVCDVSGKNPNVMFELGLRLAFDKPAIIIKDEKTSYSFDTGIIEHLPYPSGFNYKEVMKFQTTLKEKVIHTYEKGKDPNYSPFVGHFDRIKVAEIETEEVSKDDYIIEMFNEIKDSLAEIQLIQKPTLSSGLRKKMVNIDFDKIWEEPSIVLPRLFKLNIVVEPMTLKQISQVLMYDQIYNQITDTSVEREEITFLIETEDKSLMNDILGQLMGTGVLVKSHQVKQL